MKKKFGNIRINCGLNDKGTGSSTKNSGGTGGSGDDWSGEC